MTEQDLVARCRRGDRRAQRTLYDGTSRQVHRLLLKMTANAEDALDLCQETYVKVFTRIDQFDGRSSIATWIYRIAVNEALQFLRRGGRTIDRRQVLSPDPVRRSDMEDSSVELDVREALAKLAPADRALLLLRYQEGLDYGSLAVVLDTPSGTVASRLNRARQKLREILQEGYAPREEFDAVRHPKE